MVQAVSLYRRIAPASQIVTASRPATWPPATAAAARPDRPGPKAADSDATAGPSPSASAVNRA